jgi:hypothetical protein
VALPLNGWWRQHTIQIDDLYLFRLSSRRRLLTSHSMLWIVNSKQHLPLSSIDHDKVMEGRHFDSDQEVIDDEEKGRENQTE